MKNVFKNIVILLFLLIGTELTAQQDLKIIYPNGGEQLVVGTDVEIRWQGVPPQKFVILDYSTDNGQSWKRITDKATGLKYTWKVPNDASKQCLLRANLVNGVTPAEWARNTSKGFYEQAQSVVFDESGNVYICGSFYSDSLYFGNGITIAKNYPEVRYPDNQDLFIAKYTYSGEIIWAKSIGGKGRDGAESIAVDSSGNLYLAGYLGENAVDFGNGVTLKNLPEFNVFLSKFDQNGNTLWCRVAKGDRNYGIHKISLSIDKRGEVIVAGNAILNSKLDFDNGLILQRNGSNDISFVAKYTNDGEVSWVSQAFGPYIVNAIATDTNNNVYVGGYFGRKVDFGSGLEIEEYHGKTDLFVAKYNDSGAIQWVRKAEGNGSDFVTGITVDRFNNIYITGGFISQYLKFNVDVLLLRGNEVQFFTEPLMFLARLNANGDVIWAQQTNQMTRNDDGGVYSTSITTDFLGNIIIGGGFKAYYTEFSNSVALYNSELSQTPNMDIFIAKYNNRGIALWAKKAIGTDNEQINSIAINPYGDIAVVGWYTSDSLDFGMDEILWKKSLFVAKYDNEIPVGTQDISDNTWTIDKPEFSALNIDMGKVLLGAKKDSVITAFIRNEGGWPVDVRDIQLSGAHASEFQILTGKPPFIIPVNEVAAVEFRFTPAATGIRQANLTVITPIDNLYQIIQGEGVQPLISIAASLVDMGIVEIGSKKDTTLTAIVENIGSAPLKITSTTLSGAGKDAYTLVNSPGSFILQAGSTQNIELRFSPQAIGQMNAELQFEYEGMTSGPAIARITGIGIGGSMSIENDSAYAGESRFLKIMLNKHTAHNLQQQKPVGFKASLSYGNSIIAPALNTTGFTVANSNGTGTVEITSEWNGTSTELAAIPFTATLGDRTQTPLELLSFQWLNDAGEIINSDIELQDGTFTMLGICEEGGTRLYDVNGKAQMMMLAPHPANGIVEITFETVERGVTRLMLTDALGQQIVLKEGSFEKGSHSFAFDAGGLASGMYILTMQTPTQVFTQQVLIGK